MTPSLNQKFTYQDHIVRGKRLNKEKLLADKDRLREAIFTLGCFMPGMRFTVKSVMNAFGITKHIAFARIEELIAIRQS